MARKPACGKATASSGAFRTRMATAQYAPEMYVKDLASALGKFSKDMPVVLKDGTGVSERFGMGKDDEYDDLLVTPYGSSREYTVGSFMSELSSFGRGLCVVCCIGGEATFKSLARVYEQDGRVCLDNTDGVPG